VRREHKLQKVTMFGEHVEFTIWVDLPRKQIRVLGGRVSLTLDDSDSHLDDTCA